MSNMPTGIHVCSREEGKTIDLVVVVVRKARVVVISMVEMGHIR